MAVEAGRGDEIWTEPEGAADGSTGCPWVGCGCEGESGTVKEGLEHQAGGLAFPSRPMVFKHFMHK